MSPRIKRQPPFVVHFAGCQQCAGLRGFSSESLTQCEADFLHEALEATAQVLRIWASRNSLKLLPAAAPHSS